MGRTGRGFEKGSAISFYSVEEQEKLALIEEFLQEKIIELKIDQEYRLPVEEISDDIAIADMVALEEARYKKRR